MSLGERIRDYLRTSPGITAPEASRLFGIARHRANEVLAAQRDAGVIVPLPGRYPRRYRIAYIAGVRA